MKKLSLSVIWFILPLTVLAQGDLLIPNDGFAYASVFAGNFSLLLSLVIGVIATSIVFRSARKMGGGLFGAVLNYVGLGMSLIVLGTLFTVADPWFSNSGLNVLSTVFFALGYIFTVIGANKLLKGIMSN